MNDLYDLNDWMNVFRESTGKEPNERIVSVFRCWCKSLRTIEEKGKQARQSGAEPMSVSDFRELAPSNVSKQTKTLLPVMAELMFDAYMDGYEGVDAS